LPALEHHTDTYSEDDGGIKIKKTRLLDVGGFAKQGIKNIRLRWNLKAYGGIILDLEVNKMV
jgi:hypothetical protein